MYSLITSATSTSLHSPESVITPDEFFKYKRHMRFSLKIDSMEQSLLLFTYYVNRFYENFYLFHFPYIVLCALTLYYPDYPVFYTVFI